MEGILKVLRCDFSMLIQSFLESRASSTQMISSISSTYSAPIGFQVPRFSVKLPVPGVPLLTEGCRNIPSKENEWPGLKKYSKFEKDANKNHGKPVPLKKITPNWSIKCGHNFFE